MSSRAADEKQNDVSPRRRTAWAWTAVGYAFFGIGLAGTVLPVLPTTIFWIVAAGCFAKGCPAMARRIFAWPGIGPSVEAFLSHGVIARRGKLGALAGMGIAVGIVLLTPLSTSTILATIAMIALGAVYVVTRPETLPESAATGASD